MSWAPYETSCIRPPPMFVYIPPRDFFSGDRTHHVRSKGQKNSLAYYYGRSLALSDVKRSNQHVSAFVGGDCSDDSGIRNVVVCGLLGSGRARCGIAGARSELRVGGAAALEKAHAAEGRVGVCAADEDLALVGNLAEAKEAGRSVSAAGAEGGEASDPVGEGDAVENLAKGLAMKVAVQADDDEMAPKGLDLARDKHDEVVKELGFVDDDGVDIASELIGNLHEGAVGGVAGDPNTVVGDDVRICRVADVGAGLDDEDSVSDAAAALYGRVDEARFSRKHGTDDDFEAHWGVEKVRRVDTPIRFPQKFILRSCKWMSFQTSAIPTSYFQLQTVSRLLV